MWTFTIIIIFKQHRARIKLCYYYYYHFLKTMKTTNPILINIFIDIETSLMTSLMMSQQWRSPAAFSLYDVTTFTEFNWWLFDELFTAALYEGQYWTQSPSRPILSPAALFKGHYSILNSPMKFVSAQVNSPAKW